MQLKNKSKICYNQPQSPLCRSWSSELWYRGLIIFSINLLRVSWVQILSLLCSYIQLNIKSLYINPPVSMSSKRSLSLRLSWVHTYMHIYKRSNFLTVMISEIFLWNLNEETVHWKRRRSLPLRLWVGYDGARACWKWSQHTATHHSTCFMAASAEGDTANR